MKTKIINGQVLQILLVLLLIPVSLSAEGISERELVSAVTTWVREVTANNREEAEIERIEPYVHQGDTLLFIAHLRDSGFCICGAQDFMLPVYYYSPSRSYDSNKEHALAILRMVTCETQKLIEETPFTIDSILSPIRKPYWEQLADGRAPVFRAVKGFYDGPDSMSLGAVPEWDNCQGYPFNTMAPGIEGVFCPMETPDGCVAHAMSMIIRYWKWPTYPVGRDSTVYHTRFSNLWISQPLSANPFKPDFDSTACPWKGRLKWNSSVGGKLMMKDHWDVDLFNNAKKQCKSFSHAESTAFLNAMDNLWADMTVNDIRLTDIFDTTIYRWNRMPSAVGDIDTPEEIYAVSKLTFQVGLSVQMGYGVYGSGSWGDRSPEAYENHFNYDTDAIWQDLARCTTGVDTCNCPHDWDGSTPDTCECFEPDTCEGAKAIVSEIQWLRPVQFDYGHSIYHDWVIIGYNRLPLPDEMQFKDDTGWHTMGTHVTHYPIVRHIAPKNYVRFVDNTVYPFGWTGDGSPDFPYEDIEDAIADSADIPVNARLIFKAGSVNTFTADNIEIDFPVTLEGRNIIIDQE
ncbi:C10 family peptidase [bacterium]|nr:C10 family peptidase [bacterium]